MFNQTLLHEELVGKEFLQRPIIHFAATKEEIAIKMLETACLKQGEILYDLGCGEGGIVIPAAEKFKARCVGFEMDDEKAEIATRNVKERGLEDRITIIRNNFFNPIYWAYLGSRNYYAIRRAKVITIYLCHDGNEILSKLFRKELNEGTIVVSKDFSLPGWSPYIEVRYIEGLSIYGDYGQIFAYKKNSL